MITCIAIDDEPLALRQIRSYIERIPELNLVESFTSSKKAKDFLSNNEVDIMFVDINMPDINGIDLVRNLENAPMIVFTTAYSEYALEGFKLDAIDYLLKPISFEQFEHAVNKVLSLLELREMKHKKELSTSENAVMEPTVAPNREYISVKTDYKVSLIKLSDIMFIESEGEYVRMHLSDKRKIVTLFRLKNMETVLPADTFMRIHRSYIINVRYILGYSKNRVFINDDDGIPIGDNYRELFLRFIANSSCLSPDIDLK
ncbi:MAG: response regulator transcription factor [Alistipes sp.]|nr:response regulator transcription factor [Candidatus Alistipes equi]